MEVSDGILMCNKDWDPSYLRMLFDEDFYEFNNLWTSNVSDKEIITAEQSTSKYVPIVEDISIEDEVLCNAVDQVEKQ